MTDNPNATDTRDFPLGVLLSITTGVTLADFGDVHEAVDWFVGEPISTVGIIVAMPMVKRRVLDQHPGLPDAAVGIGRDNWEQYLRQQIDAHGDKLACLRGEPIGPPADAEQQFADLYGKIGSARHGQ